MENLVTILIPTYNRKKQLQDVLRSLENQTVSNFKIVIIDNASNYSINELLKAFNDKFVSKIKVVKRKFNVGADINILESFLFCETKWAWTLSDDELVRNDAIEVIYKWTNKYSEVGCFNFTLCEMFDFKNDCVEITNMDEFLDVYQRKTAFHNDLIFLSNKVYNMEKIKGCIEDAFKYIYTRISTVIIIARMIERKISYMCVKEHIVEYNANSMRSWRIYEVILASRTLNDVKYNLLSKQRKKLLGIQAFDIKYVYYLYFVEGTELKNEKNFFDQIYHGLYKYILPINEKIFLKIISIVSKNDIGYIICKKIFIFRYGENQFKNAIKKILRK